MNKCFLDIETTGLDINTSAVLEVGYLVVDDNGQVLKERHYTLKPEPIHVPYVWTQQAEDVNGISESDAMNHEYDHLSFCTQIIEDVQEDFDGTPVMYGFNVGFDYWMLQRMFNKHGLDAPFFYSLGDLNSMSEIVLGCKSSRQTAEKLQIQVDEESAHRAIYDCYLALACYNGMQAFYKNSVKSTAKLIEASIKYEEGEWGCKEELFDFMHNFFRSL